MNIQIYNTLHTCPSKILGTNLVSTLRYAAMKFVSVALLVCAQSCLAENVPAGLSVWRAKGCLYESNECATPVFSEITLYRKGNEVCGFIFVQSPFQAPGGWFAGTATAHGAKVKYVDSFQKNDDDFGWAMITVKGQRLSWKILELVESGRLGNETGLSRNRRAEKNFGPLPQSCAEFEESSSPASPHRAY